MTFDEESVAEVRKLFDKAETIIKQIESLENDALPVPPVNQLRYAGRHILNALSGKQSQEQGWYDARKHCLRAVYDGAQIGLSFFLRKIKDFENDYRAVTVVDVLPDFPNIIKEARKAQDLLANVDSDMKERLAEDCLICFESLRNSVDSMDLARVELNKKVDRQRRTDRMVIWGLIFAAASVLLTAVQLFK
ncbi:MAG: hypothetical protein HW380_3972 [Magnetococcales bacterium]|nr:hypothetical protein [Magnetococcales bacterium]